MSYHGDADKFISYLAVALKQEIKRANIKLSVEEKRIIHLPEKKERRLRRLITNAERYGKNIDDCFLQEKANTQNQQCSKKYLAALLTRQVLAELEASNGMNACAIVSLIKNTHFCDVAILKSFKNGVLPTQQEIATGFGKDKTDATRKIKQFIEKYMKNYQFKIT